MSSRDSYSSARRRALRAGMACAASYYAGRIALAAEHEPTRACNDGDDATPKQMEGPFFKPRSPERSSLLDAGIKGSRIVVSGLVLSTRCAPISHALLDFWQCDAEGNYDNRGNALRGHQYTDGQGRYRLETIVPGLYPGRTRHIHVKVQAPNQAILTTQLYFPNEPRNLDDFLYRPELLIALAPEREAARFDFVLKLS